jgi:hypothetical protein
MRPLSSPSNGLSLLYQCVSRIGKHRELSPTSGQGHPSLPFKLKVRGRSQGDTTANFWHIAARLTVVTGVAVVNRIGMAAGFPRLSRSPRVHLELASARVPDPPVAPLLPAVPDPPVAPLLPAVPDPPVAPLLPAVPDPPVAPLLPAAAAPPPGRASPDAYARMAAARPAEVAEWAGSVPWAWAGRANSPRSRPRRTSDSPPRNARCRVRSRRMCSPRPRHNGGSAPSRALRPRSWNSTLFSSPASWISPPPLRYPVADTQSRPW